MSSVNPEVILRKRRNTDRTRLEKQELSREKRLAKERENRKNKNKFIRIESIASNTLATGREKERIKRISKLEKLERKNYFLTIREIENNEEDEEESLIKEKIEYDGKPTLLFVVRVKGPNLASMPHKVWKILKVLRLVDINSGVFVKLTNETFGLFKLIAPYVIVGTPSLASIRSIIQKRARVINDEGNSVVMNDNNLIEERLGEKCGVICMEDIIHEIAQMGEFFNQCNFFMEPFKLNREVSGFNALSKLNKIKAKEYQNKRRMVNNSCNAPVVKVDVDEILSKIN
ncbi:hypothetical protein TBLA_0C01510 [Henningerozyma blattae CBS 6284]|uniref:Large ribosomal subunit protein uL30-like ferredoxin-like fold domain-containing protein n=1 Tax=Henningerozyma blattae (strain ATCC 34711 / CBS 6284 / DSM 70876 / NBRC 10599 / NRRL Y-10934 / UCD 77-7) TaxID=1071380 RepID=I2H0R4_HENB6|nr:hypothetical protein TBLA_0C01510 [Tetrapisispora blattae CBS 6284]CCH59966.1 hypothetical protein TBLA_0C01510 [Tetrapisispora blattae CBS 6284]